VQVSAGAQTATRALSITTTTLPPPAVLGNLTVATCGANWSGIAWLGFTTGSAPTGYLPQSCGPRIGAAGTGRVQCALYAKTNGNPGARLCASAASTPTANAWNDLGLSGCPALAPNTDYYIAVQPEKTDLAICDQIEAAGCWRRPFVSNGPQDEGSPVPWGAFPVTAPATVVPEGCEPTFRVTLVPF
jgi:hypothetical protein